MYLLIGFICLMIAIISWGRCKTILNPISLLFLIWAIIIPFSDSKLFTLSLTSGYSYYVIVVGLGAFLIGAILGMNNRIKIHEFHYYDVTENDQRLNYKFLYVLSIIVLLVLLYQTFQALNLLRRGYTLGAVRALLFAEDKNEMRSSSLIVVLQKFVVTPGANLMVSLIPVEIFVFKEKKNIKFLVLASIILVLWAVSSGGRTIIIALILYFVSSYVFKNHKVKKGKVVLKKDRTKFIIIIVSFILVWSAYKITIERKGADVDLVRQLYIYIGAPVKFLDYNIERLNNSFGGFRAYGMSSFYGFLYPIFFVLRFIIGHYPDTFITTHDLSISILQKVVSLGGGIRINAFSTMFYQPYVDGGIVGVILILFLFGFVSGKAFKAAFKKGSLLGLLLYFSFEYQLLFSMIRFWFTQVGIALWVVFIFFALSFVPKTKQIERTNAHNLV